MNINSKIKAQKTYVYPDTLFKNMGNVCGVDIIKKPVQSTDVAKFALQNLFHSECALIRFYGTIRSQSTIYKERLSWGRNGVIEETIEDNVAIYSENGEVKLDFHLRFLEAGEYELYIEFFGVNSQVWSKKLTVSVVDDYRNAIEMYKVVAIDDDEFLLMEDVYNILNIKGLSFQLSGNRYVDYAKHSIFVSHAANGKVYGDTIGLTHTLVLPIADASPADIDVLKPGSPTPKLKLPTKSYELTSEGVDQLLTDCDSDPMNCPDYWLYVLERPIIDRLWTGPYMPENTKMLVCIRKMFGNVGAIEIEHEDSFNMHVNEYRFYPIFHKLIPFDNSQPITHKDIIYIKPTIHHSKPITISHWEFHNDTTNVSTMSNLTEVLDFKDGKLMGHRTKTFPGGQESVLFAPQEPCLMDPGYYSIILHYQEGDIEQEFKFNSAFLLQK